MSPAPGTRSGPDEPSGGDPHLGGASLGSRAQRGASLARLSASTGSGFLTSRVRRLREGDAADARFHAETAEKVLELLGSMKGAAMKVGQILSFVDLGLPPEVQETYHEVLADLRAAAPPVDSDAIAAVIADEFGAPTGTVFAEWDPTPLASASIGQVHRARLHDGTPVVTKVQYPGVAEAVESDLANAELFAPMARVLSPNLQIRPLMEEVRARLVDELDYQREAQYQQAFFERYDGHPFIRVPAVHADYCRPRVLTTTFAPGASFEQMMRESTPAQRRRYGEIIYRFVFGSLNRFRLFNGDPHPGNYLFPGDGTVVFLDFGSVKLFRSSTRALLQEQLRAVIADDTPRLLAMLRESGFVRPDQRINAEKLMRWFRLLNEPVLADRVWTYTPDFAREVVRTTSDPRAGYYDLLRALNLPPDYVLLERIQVGVNSILGRLEATANWYRIALEIIEGAEPSTDLGRSEHEFLRASPYLA